MTLLCDCTDTLSAGGQRQALLLIGRPEAQPNKAHCTKNSRLLQNVDFNYLLVMREGLESASGPCVLCVML